MPYEITSTGPQLERPDVQQAATACEAVTKRTAAAALFRGLVVVRDLATGRAVTQDELDSLCAREQDAQRRTLRSGNA